MPAVVQSVLEKVRMIVDKRKYFIKNMITQTYQTVGTVPNTNLKIIETKPRLLNLSVSYPLTGYTKTFSYKNYETLRHIYNNRITENTFVQELCNVISDTP
jgi:hypothetical protein